MLVDLLVAGGLFLVTVPIAQTIARSERDPWMVKMVLWAVVVHMLFAPVSLFVISHYYKGLTDYSHYIGQGRLLAKNFTSFHFTLAHSTLKSPLGAGSVSIGVGIVFSFVGVNQLAASLVFGWLAFLGSLGFFRAFSVTFPDANHHRYFALVFFLPSLLFWTGGVSKESLMYASLGLAAYGAARLLAQRPGGVLLLVVGCGLGLYVRPQELMILLGCVAAATLFRGRGHRSLPLVRRAALTVVQVVLLVVAVSLTKKVSGPVFQLNKVAQLNSGLSSSITYHSSLLAYPQDLYYVVFDPLPITAHGASQFVAALENSVIVVLILTSLRRLRALPRFMVTRPYVMVATLFCAAFVYSFAALGNLGLIDRERVVMLPFLLVLLSLPVAERAPRAKRARRRGARRTYAGPLGTAWAPSGDPVLDNLLGSAGLPGAPSLEPPP